MDLIKAIQEGQKEEGVISTPSIRDKAISYLLERLSETNYLISEYSKESAAVWEKVSLDNCIKDKEILEYLIKTI